MKDLYNDIYSKLPEEKKKEILKNLAKKYNMEILRFETFSKYSNLHLLQFLNIEKVNLFLFQGI